MNQKQWLEKVKREFGNNDLALIKNTEMYFYSSLAIRVQSKCIIHGTLYPQFINGENSQAYGKIIKKLDEDKCIVKLFNTHGQILQLAYNYKDLELLNLRNKQIGLLKVLFNNNNKK